MKTSLIKRLIFWAIGMTASTMVAVILLEIGLRLFAPQLTGPVQGVFDSQLGLLPKPNSATWRKTPFYTFLATHDSAGRRTVSRAPESASERVLFLGDSFTYGSGVGDGETFSSRVQVLLLNRGTNVQVIDAGNSNVGTDFELRYFQLRGAAEKPAVVELFFFGNDFIDNAAGNFFEIGSDQVLNPKVLQENPIRRIVTMMPLHDFVMSHSQIAALLRGMTAKSQVPLEFVVNHPRLAALFKLDQKITTAPGPMANPYSERVTSIYLSQLASAVRATGATFHVFYIPSIEDVRNFRSSGTKVNEEAALERICAAQGLELTTLTPTVAEAAESLDVLYYGEGHWTARTHALAAPAILASVESDLRQAQVRY